MFLIVGLGNPGEEYRNTRHNTGFRFADAGANFLEKEGQFSGWQKEKILYAEVGKGVLQGNEYILAKPATYMNDSGKAVKALLKKYKLLPENLVVIHDDIDIAIGSYKIQKNRGSAGHKGVQSIIDAIGTKNFWRVRIGIQPKQGKPKDTNEFVMADITKKELAMLVQTIEDARKNIFELFETQKANPSRGSPLITEVSLVPLHPSNNILQNRLITREGKRKNS